MALVQNPHSTDNSLWYEIYLRRKFRKDITNSLHILSLGTLLVNFQNNTYIQGVPSYAQIKSLIRVIILCRNSKVIRYKRQRSELLYLLGS